MLEEEGQRGNWGGGEKTIVLLTDKKAASEDPSDISLAPFQTDRQTGRQGIRRAVQFTRIAENVSNFFSSYFFFSQ